MDVESSSSSSSDSSDDDKKKSKKKKSKKKSKKSSSSSSSESSESSSSSEEETKSSKKRRREEDTSEADTSSKKPKADSEDDGRIKKVYVGNLPYEITDENMREFFKDCGKIVDIQWNNNRGTGRFTGTGVFEFETHEQAVEATKLHDSDCFGRLARINLSNPPKRDSMGAGKRSNELSKKEEGCDTVFIGNLSFDIGEEQVREFFSPCGDIAEVRWVERDGEFKGCGFVQFRSSDSTDKAVSLNGRRVLGRPMRVDFANSR